ncbi:thiamine-phosphate kinase [Arthrobacter sp. CAL618]|uniref:thiamine-phosphate kinase n=1 Tax=Arthrobacter sp. CAL618 TaxID=1055770 RepID=UPI000462FB9F|nr:thiamine-phosphate kinase [Arthrobacter sp. CAL618]
MRHSVGDLGESGLLKRIFPRLALPEGTIVGPGDDAAVLAAPGGQVVLTIDSLVENQDFRLTRPNGHVTSGFDVGWKAAAQNLSDINSMGARATSLVVSLTLPANTLVQWVEDLADGVVAAITQLGAVGCGVIGGDLGKGRDLAVTIAATGTLDGRRAILRSGANPGDTVAISGTLGRAAAGLSLMESHHLSTGLTPGLTSLVNAQRRPQPPLAAGPAAARAGASAMLDVSDGLFRDAGRIAIASSATIDVDGEVVRSFAVPLQEAADLLQADPLEWVISGGEDYGLLATFPLGNELPKGFRKIGTVSEGGSRVTFRGQDVVGGGWDHFANG